MLNAIWFILYTLFGVGISIHVYFKKRNVLIDDAFDLFVMALVWPLTVVFLIWDWIDSLRLARVRKIVLVNTENDQ